MIPTPIKPKYKFLSRLLLRLRTADIWKNIKTKAINKKKWRLLRFYLKKNRKKPRSIRTYTEKGLPLFTRYRRYSYQNKLLLRQRIKLVFGGIQDYKLKQLALKSKKNSFLGFTQKIEQKVLIFIYRSKLTTTYGEAKIHFKHKRILVNGSYTQAYIQKGDVLHFTPNYAQLLKTRISYLLSQYLENYGEKYAHFKKEKSRKKKYDKIFKYYKKLKIKPLKIPSFGIIIDSNVDFDVCSIRFLFINQIRFFRNHPFYIQYHRVLRWYTRV